MKAKSTIWLCLALFIVVATGLDARTSLENIEEMERKKLSVMLLVNGTVNETGKKPLQAQDLYQRMNTNKRGHQQKGDSFELSRKHLAKKMGNDLKKRLDHVFKASGLNHIDPVWCRETEEKALEQGDILIAENLSINFGDKFNQVRSNVVKEQQARLTDLSTPQTEQDYLDVENRSPDLHKELMERSLKLYNEPIFSENQEFLSNKIDDILKDAKKQFREQRKIVEASQGGGPEEITIGSIQKAIHRDIERYRNSLHHPYNLFPSVEKSILPKSRQLTIKKFNTWVDTVHEVIPDERIRDIIEGDTGRHSKRSQSKQRLSQVFLPEIQADILNGYGETLSAKDQQHLMEFLEEQSTFQVQLEEVVERSLENFSKVRDDISREQFALYFQDLADSTWKLDENAIERRYNQDQIKDNKRIVQEFLSGQKVLEETEVLVEEAVFRLAEKGDTAIQQQMSLVENYRNKVEENTDRLFQKITAGEMDTVIGINELVEIASREIQQTWSRFELSSEYPRLFDGVKDQIRKDIKDLIPIEVKRREEVRKAEEEEKTEQQNLAQFEQNAVQNEDEGQAGVIRKAYKQDAQEKSGRKGQSKNPGTASGAGKGGASGYAGKNGGQAGKKVKNALDVIIDIDIENEKIVIVTVDIHNDGSFTFTFPLRKEKYKTYRSRVTPHLEKIENRLKDFFTRSVQDGKAEPVYIVTNVFHVRVPYGFVYDLRETVRQVGTARDFKSMPIFWYDGFLLDRDLFDLSDIRKRSNRLKAVW